MAILKTELGEVEVRIKRYPDDTYYDEYIKVEGKEKSTDIERERYIVAEPDTTFYIEVTLKEGFKIGKYSSIGAFVHLPDRDDSISSIALLSRHVVESNRNVKIDHIQKMQYADVEIDGQKMLGARFAFRKIEIDLMGIKPDHLMSFAVKLYFIESFTTRLSDNEYKKALSDWEKACSEIRFPSLNQMKLNAKLGSKTKKNQLDTKNIWDVKKIDQDSYQKHGISSAIGFVGGKPKAPRKETTVNSIYKSDPITLPKSRTVRPPLITLLKPLEHLLFMVEPQVNPSSSHNTEFLEQVGIVKYPPPLHHYSWGVLNDNERKTALSELQELSKKQWHEDREKESGMVLPLVRSRVKAEEHPWEWRHWDKMYAAEKQKAFESLQKKKKDRERGIVQREYKNIMGKIISLDGEDDELSTNPLERSRYNTQKERAKSGKEGVRIKCEEIQRAMANSSDGQRLTTVDIIKQKTPIVDDDDDSIIIVSETKNPILSLAAKEKEIALADEELRKEEAALEKPKEDIPQEERVIKMKRERDALQERIDAARSKKRIKTE
ncbi:uncharacterized protein EAE97_008332 [Botrytis byssoidea]|uniref:Uncharacterized protein n=1 Tax=Botrytis byssoidea TaxID=139641 RepID=A0A9P5ICI5_9HELO|nr:uncharacterized protein EAE97_008332 [Botrytis byssoidea]KAF7935425.1 hypothetical protein EAE97_008332 [Botrytis byssoidea]